jgi:hypothetical protein
MKAIAVFLRKSNSVHLADLPKPSVGDVPGGRREGGAAERSGEGKVGGEQASELLPESHAGSVQA